jgi:hypothetical protein
MGWDPFGRKAFKVARNVYEASKSSGNGGMIKHRDVIESYNKHNAIRQTYEDKPEGPSMLNEENILDE